MKSKKENKKNKKEEKNQENKDEFKVGDVVKNKLTGRMFMILKINSLIEPYPFVCRSQDLEIVNLKSCEIEHLTTEEMKELKQGIKLFPFGEIYAILEKKYGTKFKRT